LSDLRFGRSETHRKLKRLLKKPINYINSLTGLSSRTFTDEELIDYFKDSESNGGFNELYVDKIKELLVEKDVEFRTFEATLHFGSSLEPVRNKLIEFKETIN